MIPRDVTTMKRHDSFFPMGLLRDVLKREPTIETIPARDSITIDVKHRSEGSPTTQNAEVTEVDSDPDTPEDPVNESLEKRIIRGNVGGAPSKRAVRRGDSS